MISIDFIRDQAGRITDRTTTYGFPNGDYRDGSEFETTSYSYSPRGFLSDFATLGDLTTGSLSEGHTYGRDPQLGSMTHINEAGGGPLLWNALVDADGLLTDLWTPQGLDNFIYGTDGALTQMGDLALEYDQWNNLVTVHDSQENQDYIESYIYDFANRLVGVISPDGHIDLWVHDGQRRAERWRASNSGSTGFAYIMDEYVFGHHHHQLLAATTEESQGMLLFPLSDERHSIIGLWAEDKAEFANFAQYDPDGRIRIRNKDDSITCSEREMQKQSCYFKNLPHFGYTGAFRSTITGLSHMGARWYSARLGQFISPDPLWYIDSFDLYAYAGFDPINKWDPTGLASDGLAGTGQNQRGIGNSDSNQRNTLDVGATIRPRQQNIGARSPYMGPIGGQITHAGVPNRMLGDSGRVPVPPGYQHDPNRRSKASVVRDGNRVHMKLRLYYKGQFDEEELQRWNAMIEDAWSGQFGNFIVTTQVEYTLWQPLRVWRWNTINVLPPRSNNPAIARGQNPSVTRGVSGDWYAGMAAATAAHEAGHLLGVGDRRFVETNHAWPEWVGNLMVRSTRRFSHPSIEPRTSLTTIDGQAFSLINQVWEEDILDILDTHGLLNIGER